jgi:ribosomal protein S4
MTKEEYIARIKEKSDPEYQQGWRTLASDLREMGGELRREDATLTFIMQGMAVQIDKYLAHINKRQNEIDRAAQIVEEAKAIDSKPDLIN